MANRKHWHWHVACDGQGFYPAGQYLGMPPEDEPCVHCKEGRIVCDDSCREKDWDGPCDENGNILGIDLVWPQKYRAQQ